nr:hypothetical protein [Dictyobacter alpinus]
MVFERKIFINGYCWHWGKKLLNIWKASAHDALQRFCKIVCQMIAIHHLNGLWSSFSRCFCIWPSTISTSTGTYAGQPSTGSTSYTYDGNGNLKSITYGSAGRGALSLPRRIVIMLPTRMSVAMEQQQARPKPIVSGILELTRPNVSTTTAPVPCIPA